MPTVPGFAVAGSSSPEDALGQRRPELRLGHYAHGNALTRFQPCASLPTRHLLVGFCCIWRGSRLWFSPLNQRLVVTVTVTARQVRRRAVLDHPAHRLFRGIVDRGFLRHPSADRHPPLEFRVIHISQGFPILRGQTFSRLVMFCQNGDVVREQLLVVFP